MHVVCESIHGASTLFSATPSTTAQEEYPALKEALLALPEATQHVVIASGIPVVWTSVRCGAFVENTFQDARILGLKPLHSHSHARPSQIPKMEFILRMIENAVNRWSCCMALASKTGGLHYVNDRL